MNIYDLEKIRLNLFVTSDVDEKNFEYFFIEKDTCRQKQVTSIF